MAGGKLTSIASIASFASRAPRSVGAILAESQSEAPLALALMGPSAV